MKVSEVNITPIRPLRGLVAFASILIDDSIYLSSIAVYLKLDGSFRLLYPTKNVGQRMVNVFHPVNREASLHIEKIIFEKCNELLQESNDYDRHHKASPVIIKTP